MSCGILYRKVYNDIRLKDKSFEPDCHEEFEKRISMLWDKGVSYNKIISDITSYYNRIGEIKN